jgi:hypothetical protein
MKRVSIRIEGRSPLNSGNNIKEILRIIKGPKGGSCGFLGLGGYTYLQS